jgi:hypothetical protein
LAPPAEATSLRRDIWSYEMIPIIKLMFAIEKTPKRWKISFGLSVG